MFKVPRKGLSGNFYNDGIGGLGDTGASDMRSAMLRANSAGCGCIAPRIAPPPTTLGSWIGDLFSSAGSGALNIVKSAGAGEAATRLEEQRIAAAAAAAAANAPKAGGIGGISTNTMLIVGAGAVGIVALILLTKKKG